jgi:hypothetical protein
VQNKFDQNKQPSNQNRFDQNNRPSWLSNQNRFDNGNQPLWQNTAPADPENGTMSNFELPNG